MNLVDCTVVEVLGEPVMHESYGRVYYTVPIKYDSWGAVNIMDFVCMNLEHAKAVKVGFKFLA